MAAAEVAAMSTNDDDKPWMREFGLSIPVTAESAEMLAEFEKTQDWLRKAHDAAIDYMWLSTNHRMHQPWRGAGVETDPNCPLCAWDFRWNAFFNQIAQALELCTSCGEPNWLCDNRCDASCDCQCACRRCNQEEPPTQFRCALCPPSTYYTAAGWIEHVHGS